MALIMTKCFCNYSCEHYFKHTFLEQKDKEKTDAEKREEPLFQTAFAPSDSQDT